MSPTIKLDSGEIVTSSSLLCREPGCNAQLRLTQTTRSESPHMGGVVVVSHALKLAAKTLDWTLDRCPVHQAPRCSCHEHVDQRDLGALCGHVPKCNLYGKP